MLLSCSLKPYKAINGAGGDADIKLVKPRVFEQKFNRAQLPLSFFVRFKETSCV